MRVGTESRDAVSSSEPVGGFSPTGPGNHLWMSWSFCDIIFKAEVLEHSVSFSSFPEMWVSRLCGSDLGSSCTCRDLPEIQKWVHWGLPPSVWKGSPLLGLFALPGCSWMRSLSEPPTEVSVHASCRRGYWPFFIFFVELFILLSSHEVPWPGSDDAFLHELFCMNYIPWSHKLLNSSSPSDLGLCD